MKLQANSLKIIVTFTAQQFNSTVWVQFIIKQPSIKTSVFTDIPGQITGKYKTFGHHLRMKSNNCCYYLQPMLFLCLYKDMVKMLFNAVVCSKDN